jgi:hypothetical protein
MTVHADDFLGVYIPSELMEESDYYGDYGHGCKCGSVYELRVEAVTDYIMNNQDSELAKHFVEDGAVDLDNRAEVIKHINSINNWMGEEI